MGIREDLFFRLMSTQCSSSLSDPNLLDVGVLNECKDVLLVFGGEYFKVFNDRERRGDGSEYCCQVCSEFRERVSHESLGGRAATECLHLSED